MVLEEIFVENNNIEVDDNQSVDGLEIASPNQIILRDHSFEHSVHSENEEISENEIVRVEVQNNAQ